MSKRITSFLVIAAVALLAIPAQAQTLKKKAPSKKIEAPQQMKLTTPKAQKDAQLKAADTTEGLAFRKADGTRVDVPTQQNVVREPRVALEGNAMPVTGVSSRQVTPVRHKAPRRADSATGEEVDEHGIIISPAQGEEQTYTRAGTGYYYSGGYVNIGNQSGTVTIVDCGDGTVYIQDPISYYATGAWVKGTKAGNTITVPISQPLYYNENYSATISLRWGNISAEGSISAADSSPEVFTFTISGDVISLQGTAAYAQGVETNFMGAFWDDDNSFGGYGDAETVWTKLNVISQVDELPYSNDFNDAGAQASCTIIDANEDSRTWMFGNAGATGNTAARYQYSSANTADDWLILPKIKLEAGKTYHVAIDAWAQSATYPERVEVKLGKEATAAALTTDVIAATDVTWNFDNVQTLETGSVGVSEDGYYFFGIHAISDPDEYVLNVDNFTISVIEGAAPAAVSDFAVVPAADEPKATISFKAPTKMINGDDLTENISVNVLRDGELITTLADVAPGSEQSYVDNATVGTHKYQVIPVNAAGAEGQKSEEISVFLTAILTVPYAADLTQQGALEVFTVIDANEDGKTWKWSSNGAICQYNSSAAADDYLITLPITLQAGKKYNVIVNAMAYSSSYPERFEVKLGKEATVAGLNKTIIEPTDLTSAVADDYEAEFSVEEAGNYYVAIHGISDADMYYLVVKKLTIEDGAELKGPAAPALDPIAGGLGDMSATIKVTAPTAAVDGTALTDNLTKIEIYRDGELVGQIDNVAPGATKRFLDEDFTASGFYTYQAIPYNAIGKGQKSAKAGIFVGLDEPAAVENFAAADQLTSVALTWDKVGGEGVNGGYVNPAEVTYNVWSTKIESSIFGDQLVLDQVLNSGVDYDNYVVDYNTEEGTQGYEYWVVETANDATDPDQGGYMVVAPLVVGESYALPVEEGFADQSLHYFWTGDAGLAVTDDATDEDGVALQLYSEEAGVFGFESGKLNLKTAANPTLIFDVKGVGISSMNVTGSVDGAELAQIQTVAVGSDYATVKVPLTALKNGSYARIGFSANFVTPTVVDIDWDALQYVYDWGDLLIIDNIRVVDLYEYDLAADVKAPAKVIAGNKAAITATVTNRGENPANGYTVKITAGDKEIFNKTVNDVLAPFAKSEFTADFATSVFDEAGDVTIKMVVDYENELNPDNNEAEALISVVEPSVAAPATLTATDNGVDGVDLVWTLADARAAAATVTESFETEGDLGGFTSIDADGDGYDWGQHINTGSQNFQVHEGDGSVFSASYINNVGALTPDNWFVTPAATLDGTFSFWACGQDASYAAEHFAVFVSTTSATDPSAFTQVSEEFVATGEMTEYTVDLSSFGGATGYIAIRHFNVTDMFYLVVDDVTYIPAGGAPVVLPESFNVYYEQEKLANVAADVTTYTAKADQIGVGTHTFAVTAVYAGGAESKPVTATVEIVNSINQIAVNGQPVDVYTLDGKLIRRQVTSLDGLKGIYIINGKKVMVK